MKLLDKLLGRKAAQLTYDQVASLIDGVGGGSVAGVVVTDKTALQVSTVLACVKVIADGCATPDLHVFRELADGTRQKATNIPEYRLLSRRPNEWQTSFEWRRQMTIHAALTGAGLSIKVRGDNRRVRELIPVMPGRNLAVIIETAAINNRQKEMGYNAAKELLKQLGLNDDANLQ